MPDYLTPGGVIVPAGSLELPRARALADTAAFDQLPYVELVECFSNAAENGLTETVVIDVVVERPQHPVNAIDRTDASPYHSPRPTSSFLKCFRFDQIFRGFPI